MIENDFASKIRCQIKILLLGQKPENIAYLHLTNALVFMYDRFIGEAYKMMI
jgi:hypothetical protein